MAKLLNAADKILVRRMLAGDQDAFDAFFEGHFPALYRFALRRLGQDTDAAGEVAQLAICKAIRKLATYRGEAALRTWLFTFCRHELSSFLERRGRAPQPAGLLDEMPEIRAALESLIAPPSEGPEAELERKEIVGLVRLTLDHLPPHYSQALEWKYMHDLPVKEIARRLELAPKAAESLLTRARQAFRDAFATVSGERLGSARTEWAFASPKC